MARCRSARRVTVIFRTGDACEEGGGLIPIVIFSCGMYAAFSIFRTGLTGSVGFGRTFSIVPANRFWLRHRRWPAGIAQDPRLRGLHYVGNEPAGMGAQLHKRRLLASQIPSTAINATGRSLLLLMNVPTLPSNAMTMPMSQGISGCVANRSCDSVHKVSDVHAAPMMAKERMPGSHP